MESDVTKPLPAVIGLNGPPGAGKGWLVKFIQNRLIPDAISVSVPEMIFDFMVADGVIPEYKSYMQFKSQDEAARDKMIRYVTEKRLVDMNYITRRITETSIYRDARVIIFDNVGFNHEEMWLKVNSSALLLLRIDTEYYAKEPWKSRGRRLTSTWPKDSRYPVKSRRMLTAYDSLQMSFLLNWLNNKPTSDEAGPYNGIAAYWANHFYFNDDRQLPFASTRGWPGFQNQRPLDPIDIARAGGRLVSGSRRPDAGDAEDEASIRDSIRVVNGCIVNGDGAGDPVTAGE